MINFIKSVFSKNQNQIQSSDKESIICLGKKFSVLKKISPINNEIEIIVRLMSSSSIVFSKVLTGWYIDNSNFPEAVLSSDERFLVICGYYYNPVLIIDLQKQSVYWEIGKYKNIYEFSMKDDQIQIRDCTDEDKQKFQSWKIDIRKKQISEINNLL